jgi:hypothetical protein
VDIHRASISLFILYISYCKYLYKEIKGYSAKKGLKNGLGATFLNVAPQQGALRGLHGARNGQKALLMGFFSGILI